MQKHRTRQLRKSRRWKNANYRLSASDRTAIAELSSSVDGGENPALTYLRESYRSKFCDESLVPASERRSAAIEKFRATECSNASTNEWWRTVDPGFNLMPRVTVRSFLRFARRMIRDILGPLTDEVILGKFSGGASTSRRRTESIPALKYVGKADMTEGLVPYVDLLIRHVPMFRQYETSFSNLVEVKGNVLFTVPKKTDIDRCACKEPDVNMYLQKGVGSHIRRRLRRFGINLNDQSINRNLAYLGSINGELMTLDLSAASDSMTISIVQTLLPKLWFEYLDDIRSHYTLIDEEYVRLEMFSSMGNGFTFELESLIFFALTRTVQYFKGISGVCSVYGDDIIAMSSLYDDLTFVLRKFGFSTNDDKSFHTGPFRESCGGHYHNGEDITPFYLKKEAQTLTDLIRVANQFRKWVFASPFRQHEVTNSFRIWKDLADRVPKDLWGGYDYALDTKLVSPPGGSKILVRVNEPSKSDQLGEYLQWHNQNWNRTSDVIVGAKPVSTNQICRLRRAPPGAPVIADYFLQELIGNPVSS